MDAARAAKRVPGVEKVSIIYRRTRKYMPADTRELEEALKEEVEFRELLVPVAWSNGILSCQRMELTAPDASGRRSPVPLNGEFARLHADCMISAVGEQTDTELFVQIHIELDENGNVMVNPDTNETSIDQVFIGGDALRGPSTIVEAIADGTKFADIVLEREKRQKLQLNQAVELIEFDRVKQLKEIKDKKGVLCHTCSSEEECSRCLECQIMCSLCVEVCPNRANVAVSVTTPYEKCSNQIIHIDGLCNECGNCAAFCPYDSAPYREKLTLYWKEKDFEDSTNAGFILLDGNLGLFRVRLDNKIEDIIFDRSGNYSGSIPKNIADMIRAVYQNYSYFF
jgi:putative selenate reductase